MRLKNNSHYFGFVYITLIYFLILTPKPVWAQGSELHNRCGSLFELSLKRSKSAYTLQEVTSGGLTFFYNPTTKSKEGGTNVVAKIYRRDGELLGWISYADAAILGLPYKGVDTFDEAPVDTLDSLIEIKGLKIFSTSGEALRSPKPKTREESLPRPPPLVAVSVDPSVPPKYAIGTWVSAGLRPYFDLVLRKSDIATHTVFELLDRERQRIGWINNVDAFQRGLPKGDVDSFENLEPGLLEALIDVYGLTVYPNENKALVRPKD